MHGQRRVWSMQAALVVVLMAGCAAPQPKVWYKDGASVEQFRRDQIACRQYGMQSAQANGLSGNLFVELWISREAEGCMRGLGYTESAAHSVATYAPPPAASPPLAAPQPPPAAAIASPSAARPAPAAQPVPAAPDAERAQVAKVLADSGFPLSGAPVRFKQSGGRSFYEARGTGGQLTQVICDPATGCRLRTAHD